MGAMSRAHCRDYLDMLRFMPRNASKRFPKLSLTAPRTARGRCSLSKKEGRPQDVTALSCQSAAHRENAAERGQVYYSPVASVAGAG